MSKFSLYDFLGLLLPGVMFLFFFNEINNIYEIYPRVLDAKDLKLNIGILSCFVIIIGAVLYVSSFYLVKKNFYKRIFGVYKPITVLYREMFFLHEIMNPTLNKKANDLYDEDLFFSNTNFDSFSPEKQNKIDQLQDVYYDQMYYELEYQGKNEHAKSFQSFYFFFRQTVLAISLLLIFQIILSASLLFPCGFIKEPKLCIVIVLGCLSILLAKWYRKQMVMKMYWAYYTHLNQNTK